MTVSRGFPQCSGISPISQFADDTTLAAADPSLTVVAQSLTASFNSVKEFCDSHELVNSSKTQLIVFKPVG